MELRPASIAQLVQARDGRWIEIDADVGGVVQQIKEIDPGFGVVLSETQGIFKVTHTDEAGEETLVTTAQELDGRLLTRLRQIASERYDFVAEMEAMDAAAERENDVRLREQLGEASEKLSWAVRKDLGVKRHF